jgi:peptide/nickel transport system ATP-binding protein
MKADGGPLMQLKDLRKSYRLRRSLAERIRGINRTVTAVDGVSFAIPRGGILGLVGESGCGKSTLAQMIVGLLAPSRGEIEWNGIGLSTLSGDARRVYRRGVQMVFQDTHSSQAHSCHPAGSRYRPWPVQIRDYPARQRVAWAGRARRSTIGSIPS